MGSSVIVVGKVELVDGAEEIVCLSFFLFVVVVLAVSTAVVSLGSSVNVVGKVELVDDAEETVCLSFFLLVFDVGRIVVFLSFFLFVTAVLIVDGRLVVLLAVVEVVDD